MKVSVIIPVFNQQDFLKESVSSVLSNSYSDLEIIIVNDGSSDDSLQVAHQFQVFDKRIIVIDQSNMGLSGARNTGIENASGDIIHFLDCDDLVLADCYDSVVKEIQNTDILVSSYSYLKDGKLIHTHHFTNQYLKADTFLVNNIAPPISFFLKKESVQNVGIFDTSLKSCEDWDYWQRAFKLGLKFKSINQTLVIYRYLIDSMSRNPSVMYQALTEVSRRATVPDSRLSVNALHNQTILLNLLEIQKNHLIILLGVMLHQGRVKEAVEWYLVEEEKWNWKIQNSDWKGLSSYLSWGYFFEPVEIRQLIQETVLNLNLFFDGLGYSKDQSKEIIRMIFKPQLKRRNHQRYGKLMGSILNKFGLY